MAIHICYTSDTSICERHCEGVITFVVRSNTVQNKFKTVIKFALQGLPKCLNRFFCAEHKIPIAGIPVPPLPGLVRFATVSGNIKAIQHVVIPFIY